MSNADEVVSRLLKQSLVVDGHSDVLIPLTENKMSVAERVEIPDEKSWIAPQGMDNHPFVQFGLSAHTVYFGCMGQYDIPRWREGHVDCQLCAVYLDDEKLSAPFVSGMEMVRAYHQAVDENEALVHCTTVQEIRNARNEGKIAWVLTFEGCESLGHNIDTVDLYHKLGLRAASLTHTRRNQFAEGCWGADRQGGLTELGKSLIRKLEELKIVVDLVHIGDVSYWDILEIAEQPVILSHSTPTMFASTDARDRDFLDGKLPRPRIELPRDREMLEAIAKNGGVLGMIWLLYRDLDAAVADIEMALEIIGQDHIGLGSDLYGQQLTTPGLEDISKVPNLVSALVRRGHSEEFLVKFLGENYLRVFETVWGS